MSTVILPETYHLLPRFPPKQPPPQPPPPAPLCTPLTFLSRPKRHSPTLSIGQSLSHPQTAILPPLSFISDDFSSASTTSGRSETKPEADDAELVGGSFLYLLRLSVRYQDPELAKAVHACVIKLTEEDVYFFNALISAYIKLGLVPEAFRVFLGLTSRNVVSYTAMISGFAKSNREFEAIRLFSRMRNAGIEPNEYTAVAVLTACMRISRLQLGLQVHGLTLKMGFSDCVYVANALMALYSSHSGRLGNVLRLFDKMAERDIASWNTAMSSFVKESKYEEAFSLFHSMKRDEKIKIDSYTLSTLLTACTGNSNFIRGKEIHAHAIRVGLHSSLSINNALIALYTNCGDIRHVVTLFEMMPVRDVITWTEMITAYMEFGMIDAALEMFENMPEKNCVSYNALLSGFCRNGEGLKSLQLFVKMVEKRVELTDSSLTSVVNASGLLTDKKVSEQIHGFVIKFGFGSNSRIEAALLDMCTRCGRLTDAETIFSRWPSDWDASTVMTSMFCGYARYALPDNALCLFHMHFSEGKPILDEISLASILAVCGTLGFGDMGDQFHGLALKTGYICDAGVANSLIAMYSKCCSTSSAVKAFNIMPKHDVVSWNCLIAGHVLHRQGDEALNVWSKMRILGIRPDEVTLGLVIASYKYTKSNLVGDCRRFLDSMKADYGIEPNSECYASFIGVLGHWGFLDEAEDMINSMPFEPGVSILRPLLDSCRVHVNFDIGKRIAKRILAMEPVDPSSSILKSNLYAASGIWHCAEMVRENMKEKGFQKFPARCWTIQRDEVHSFYTRDRSHVQEKDIYRGLDILILECMKFGYNPDTSYVLHEVEEYQKRGFLYYHSAKLAVTFGILMNGPGKPVRVVKNIMLCGDCHEFMKFVSVVTKREIVVRDSSGFHYFVDGQCSCKDRW